MSRLATVFASLEQQRRKALVVYLTAGDPDFETAREAAHAAIAAGADILEVGVPFSDPIADGPVIQRAMKRALDGGGGIGPALMLVRELRQAAPDIPLVVFGYINPLLSLGQDAFAEVAAAGADGVLVVDVPPEESGDYKAQATAAGLDWVSLVAPTTPPERVARIAGEASGFVYLVSMTGVTGGALSGVEALRPTVGLLRGATKVPVCIGFGVRDRQTAASAAALADGVVVGSAIVEALEQGAKAGNGPQRVAQCVEALRAGVDAAEGAPGGL